MEYDEKLIILVERRDVLYNKLNTNYKNTTVKRKVWEEIGKELQLTGDRCLQRWTALREKYGREKRQYTPSESGVLLRHPWPMYHKLQFLDQHIRPRPNRSKWKENQPNRCTAELYNFKSSSHTIVNPPPPSSQYNDPHLSSQQNVHQTFLQTKQSPPTTFSPTPPSPESNPPNLSSQQNFHQTFLQIKQSPPTAFSPTPPSPESNPPNLSSQQNFHQTFLQIKQSPPTAFSPPPPSPEFNSPHLSSQQNFHQTFLQIKQSPPTAFSPPPPSPQSNPTHQSSQANFHQPSLLPTSFQSRSSISTSFSPPPPSPESSLSHSLQPSSAPRGSKNLQANRKRTNEYNIDKDFHEACEAFKKSCQAQETLLQNPTLHLFGQTVIATISRMSAAKQSNAMRRVTELLLQIEQEPEL